MRDDTREMLMLMSKDELQGMLAAAKERLHVLIEQPASAETAEAIAQATAVARTYREAIKLKERK
jgi:hypothetical protein